MNIRSKKIILPTIAAVAVLGVGGVAWAASSDDSLDGTTRDRASAAALDAVGGGKVIETDRNDDEDVREGDGRYEVTVLKGDGTEVEVKLDEKYAVIGQPETDRPDDATDDRDDRSTDTDDSDDSRDADDRVLSASERARAAKAAEARVTDATVTDVDAGDDRVGGKAVAYEVDLVKADGVEWSVDLDRNFTVIRAAIDR